MTDDFATALRQVAQSLIDTGAASYALHAGGYAPPVRLLDTNGVPLSLERRFAKQPLILVFSRGPWCPVSRAELSELQDFLPALVQTGAGAAAITPQLVADNRATAEGLGLNFPLLSDSRGRIARAFGLHYKLSTGVTALGHAEIGASLPAADRAGRSWLAMSARYVIGPTGIIEYSEVDPNPTRPPEFTRLLRVLAR